MGKSVQGTRKAFKPLDVSANYKILIQRLEDTCGVLPLTDDKGNRIGWIKNAVFEFNDASDSLDISFTLSYEVAYERARPTEPPAPRYVGTRVTLNEENKERG